MELWSLFQEQILGMKWLNEWLGRGGISHKVLTENLKELEVDELVIKITYDEMPPKVEYYLTEKGKEITKIIEELEIWSKKYYPNINKTF